MNSYLFDTEINNNNVNNYNNYYNNSNNSNNSNNPHNSNNPNKNNPNNPNKNNPHNSNKIPEFTIPQISNQSKPMNTTHDNYIFDRNSQLFYNNKMGNYHNPTNTRFNENVKPVQNDFQNQYAQNFMMSNFETINNGQEKNLYIDRNPVITRRDQIEKTRNDDRNIFLKNQGGNLNNFTKFQYDSTRKEKNEINTSSYIPSAKTMAMPKENI